jgi:hypothetical protein
MNEAARATAEKLELLPIPEGQGILELASPIDRVKAMCLASVLPDWATLVKRECTKRALEFGDGTPGFALRRRMGNLTIKDLQHVLAFAEEQGISRNTVLEEAASVSLSKLTDLLMKAKPIPEAPTKKDYSLMLEEVLGDAVSRAPDVVYLQKDSKKSPKELVEQLVSNPEMT